MITARDVLHALEADLALDEGTVRRGYDYADRGRVMRVDVGQRGPALVISAVIAGTRIYQVEISAEPTPTGVAVDSRCSCPMAFDCKHVVAAAVRAAVRHGVSRPPDWRRLLDEVVDDQPEPDQPADHLEATPVAVQMVVAAPSRGRHRFAQNAASRPRLGVRAVRWGASGRWVKSQMGWAGLSARGARVAGGRFLLDDDQVDLLLELRSALIGRRGYLTTTDEAIDLHDAGPALWPVLGRIADAGIEVISSDPEVDVEVRTDPAELQLDIRADGEQARLMPGVTSRQDWFDADDLAVIGEPGHGVVLWSGGAGQPGSRIRLTPLSRPPSRTVRGWLGSKEPLQVPRRDLGELVGQYLPRIASSLPTISSDASVRIPAPPTIRLRCQVTWDDAGAVELDWRWSYRGESHDGSVERQQFPVDDRTVRGLRDIEREIALLDGLALTEPLAELMGLHLAGRGTLVAQRRLRDLEAMRFAQDLLPVLEAADDLEVISNAEPPQFRSITAAPEIRFTTATDAHRRDRTDWLDLDVVVSVTDAQLGTVQLDVPRVLEALITGETRIMIHPGVFVDVDRPEFDALARLVHDARALSDQPRRGIRVSRQAHGLLADIDEIGPTEGQLRSWAEASTALRRLARSGEPLPTVPLPAGLQATLRPYQHDGYQWLAFLHGYGLGGILADDMGLGKTVQMLALIAGAVDRASAAGEARRPFLVVAPSSVVTTWRSQADQFTPGLNVITVTGSQARRGWSIGAAVTADQPVDVVVTTYTLLRLEADQYAGIEWAGLIIDEAQTVKNHRSRTYAAIRDLDSRSRFAITGTPIENNLMELWALLSLSAPGLFPHAAAFGDQFAKPIEQEADTGALETLRQRIRPVMLRRTKEVVAAELPPKQQQVLRVELGRTHRRVYDTHLQRERQRILALLDDLDDNRISVLASLTRLRQLSLDPALVDPAHDQVGSAKIDTLVERVRELAAEGHRALVFSQFTGFLRRVRDRLDREGIAHAYLDGSTTDRGAVIEGFREGDAPVFCISLKAGGTGLTLIEADYCFLLDPWWNPAVEAQAIDRTHRIGQTRPVMVYRLVSADTIEDKVVELAERKAELYRSVLDDTGDGFDRGLTAADISALLES